MFMHDGEMAAFGVGIARADVEIAFPVSPKVCLYIDRGQGYGRRLTPEGFVREINHRMAFAAEEIVIAHVESNRIEALVRETARERPSRKWDREGVRRSLEERFPSNPKP
jgi:hypothetical protein